MASFVSVPEAYATHVRYDPDINHSALMDDYNGGDPWYISKWGGWGVYRHKKNDSPFDPADATFYHQKFTHDSQAITGTETWLSGQKHILLGDITISGGTVTVGSNATVYGDQNTIHASGGTLNATSVTFTTNPDNTGYWGGIEMGSGTLSGVTIKRAYTGLTLYDVSYYASVSGTTIQDCQTGMYLNEYANDQNYVNGLSIQNSSGNGIQCLYSESNLTNVTVSSSGSNGIYISNSNTSIGFSGESDVNGAVNGLYVTGNSSISFNQSQVRNCSSNELKADNSGWIYCYNMGFVCLRSGSHAYAYADNADIDARYTWWGTTPQASWFTEANGGDIQWDNWLTSPPGWLSKPVVMAAIAEDVPLMLLQQALELKQQKQYPSAIQYCKRVIEEYSNSRRVPQALTLLDALHTNEEHLTYLETLDFLPSQYVDLLEQQKVGTLVKCGRYQEAVRRIEHYIEATNGRAESDFLFPLYSIYYYSLRDADKADVYGAKLVAHDTDHVLAQFVQNNRRKDKKPLFGTDAAGENALQKNAGIDATVAITGLQPNYPNPFNPSTTIQFGLKDAGLVKIRIYDVLGREVAILVNQYLPAGMHQVVWNGSGQSSGIYFVRMEAAGFVETQKAFLLK